MSRDFRIWWLFLTFHIVLFHHILISSIAFFWIVYVILIFLPFSIFMLPICRLYMISQLLTKINLSIPNVNPTHAQPRDVRDTHSKHLRELPFANIASQSSHPYHHFSFCSSSLTCHGGPRQDATQYWRITLLQLPASSGGFFSSMLVGLIVKHSRSAWEAGSNFSGGERCQAYQTWKMFL